MNDQQLQRGVGAWLSATDPVPSDLKADPFLERFTVADLRSWADRKMRAPGS